MTFCVGQCYKDKEKESGYKDIRFLRNGFCAFIRLARSLPDRWQLHITLLYIYQRYKSKSLLQPGNKDKQSINQQ